MSIDPSSYTPVYVQLADLLRERINSGDLAAGQMLASELALCQEYGISRIPVRRAIAVLRSEGLVVTLPRLGSYVRGPAEATVVHVDQNAEIRSRMPTPEERRRFGLPEGTPVLVVSVTDRDDIVYPADSTILRVDDQP